MNELEIKFNDKSHTWELSLENAVALCQSYIEEKEQSEIVIDNEDAYKLIRDNRTEINNKVREIKNTRIQACRSITGEFERSCKELETLLIEAGQRMTERLESYKPRKKTDKYVLTITTLDKKAYDKVKNYALKYGCEIKGEEK